jgi:hypothetical protein
MKKLIVENLYKNSVLNMPSAISGLQMFSNTPHSGSGQSPAQLIFCIDIPDSLPNNQKHLLPQLHF